MPRGRQSRGRSKRRHFTRSRGCFCLANQQLPHFRRKSPACLPSTGYRGGSTTCAPSGREFMLGPAHARAWLTRDVRVPRSMQAALRPPGIRMLRGLCRRLCSLVAACRGGARICAVDILGGSFDDGPALTSATVVAPAPTRPVSCDCRASTRTQRDFKTPRRDAAAAGRCTAAQSARAQRLTGRIAATRRYACAGHVATAKALDADPANSAQMIGEWLPPARAPGERRSRLCKRPDGVDRMRPFANSSCQ